MKNCEAYVCHIIVGKAIVLHPYNADNEGIGSLSIKKKTKIIMCIFYRRTESIKRRVRRDP